MWLLSCRKDLRRHCRQAEPVVKMLGRWHGPFTGWVVAETDDLKEVYEWTTQWSDLLEFAVVPVLEDAELGEVLSKLA